jgi:alcohol dehydrogenase
MPWRLPTQIAVEEGILTRAGAATRAAIGGSRVLLVVDPGLGATAWPELVRCSLEDAGYEVDVASEVEPNPRIASAALLGERARSTDGVIALGGGSALDAAKAAAMLATNPQPPLELVGREKYRNPPLPFVACPTTCGTGSEVTWVSVLTDPASRRKVSLKGVGMFPRLALVDPAALATLPRHLIASTAMDALTHAVEATVGRARNAVSDTLAEQAIRLVFRSLERFWRDPEDGGARHDTALASTVAGMAFGNADVATVHCLSESIGGVADLPHGLLNACLLAPTLRFLGESVETRLAELERSLGGVTTSAPAASAAFIARVEALAAVLELPSFGALDLDPELDREIAANAEANGSNPSSPRPMDASAYRRLLEAARG